jgi:hypothetical protein
MWTVILNILGPLILFACEKFQGTEAKRREYMIMVEAMASYGIKSAQRRMKAWEQKFEVREEWKRIKAERAAAAKSGT